MSRFRFIFFIIGILVPVAVLVIRLAILEPVLVFEPTVSTADALVVMAGKP